MEIKDITYSYHNKEKKIANTVFIAEDMITNNVLQINNNLKQFREKTQLSTLYFFNELANNLASIMNSKN